MTRTHLIGGTDAATLLGLGRISPTVLYLRLRGELKDDFEGNVTTDAGKLFEEHVAVPLVKKYLNLDLVRPESVTLTLPDEPRIGASLDYAIAGSDHTAEIKLTGSRAMWGDPGEKVPLHVAAQAQFQMAVARARGRAVPVTHVIAMFIPGFVVEDFEVEEDQAVGDALLKRAKAALRGADRSEAPEPGSEEDARALFLGRRGLCRVATHEEIALIEQYRQAKAAEKQVEDALTAIRDALLPAMGDATELVTPDGEVLATWRPNRYFDEVKLQATNPELWAACSVTRFSRELLEANYGKKVVDQYMVEPTSPSNSVRPFKVKEVKKEKAK